MEHELEFASDKTKLKRDVAEYREASPSDRLAALLELSELSAQLREASPYRTRQLQLLDEFELESREHWKKWIRAYAGRHSASDAAR